jgi:predicted nucleotide-binding protein
MMAAALDLALRLSDEIEQFPLGKCGPSDDPDMQYAYTASFRDIAQRFVGAIKRIGDPVLSELVSSLDLNISSYIAEAHDLRSELNVVIDALKERNMGKQDKSKALERLHRALDEISGLKPQRHGSAEFKKWHRNTEVAIAKSFGDESQHVKEFTRIRYSLGLYNSNTPDSSFQRAYVNGLDSASSILQSMIEEVEEYWEEEVVSTTPLQRLDSGPKLKTDVFIIHGRDDAAKETVARFITTLGLQPIILHEQSNQGRTIIEKFERHAEVGFAIALLTPDDVGGLKDDEESLQPRARQNVIFEFGYFMGRLGRSKVCALTKGDVEIPSDYHGVMYIRMDCEGAWKMNLVKELKAADFTVDANLVL